MKIMTHKYHDKKCFMKEYLCLDARFDHSEHVTSRPDQCSSKQRKVGTYMERL